MKIIDLAVLIRKHVPGLVADTRAVLDLGDDSKSGDAVQVMLSELQALGDEARDALAAMRDRAEDNFPFAKCASRKDGWKMGLSNETR